MKKLLFALMLTAAALALTVWQMGLQREPAHGAPMWVVDGVTLYHHRPGHDRRYALDCSKIEKEFGWKPAYSFKEGIAKTIEWYKNKSLKI